MNLHKRIATRGFFGGTGGGTGGGSTGGGGTPTEKWLFQNQQFEVGQFYDLPAPVDNCMYTVFIDGVEMVLTTVEFIPGLGAAFGGDDFGLLYYAEMGGWALNPDFDINSGSVSVLIKEKGRVALVIERAVLEITEEDLFGTSVIGMNALSGCRNLVSVTLPNTVKTIDYGSFTYCDALTEITIPRKVTEIGNHAFENCYSLKKVVVKAERPPQLGVGVFEHDNALEQIIVPYGCGNAYKSATNWSLYADKIVEESGGGSADGNWLVEDLYVTVNTPLGSATIEEGVSYTVFVNGEEKVTGALEEFWGDRLGFFWYGGCIAYDKKANELSFVFDPPSDWLTESGSVSIRVNG